MADRYWVGGTATWDGTAGTKWAATSGGPGGETVPTTADDVFFSSASTGTVTIAAGSSAVAKSINCTGFTGTLTGGSTSGVTVAGSVTLVAGMTYSHTGTFTITDTGTLTTAGKTFSAVTIDASGFTVTLGDALNISSRSITVSRGTFDTANYSVTAGTLSSNISANRTITLGSSTVTLSSNWSFSGVGLTFNAGTSQINLSSASASVLGGGVTFYNVSFTSTSASATSRSIASANTFNNLTFSAPTSGHTQFSLSATQIVNGLFTCAGSSAVGRCFVFSSTIGISRTITAAAISADDCDFRDITIAGAASPISPTRAGDCGGNTNITFPAAKTVYRVGANTGWAGSSSWALTSGGSGSNDNFPLAQDTAVIDENTPFTGTLTLTSTFNIGALDCSTRTTGITLSHNAICNRYGSYILGPGITISATSPQTFSGRGTMDFTSAGKTITFAITVDAPGGTFRLGDACNSSVSLSVEEGTFNANNYNVTHSSVDISDSTTRTLTMGSGLWTITGTGTVWQASTVTGLTFNKDTANILLSNSTTSSVSFASGSLTYNKLTIGGGSGIGTVNINNTVGSSSGSFSELASTRTAAFNLQLGNSSTAVIGTWSVTGTPGNVVTVNSPTTGTRRTFTLTNVTSGIDYLAVQDIGELSNNKFYVGANSTDNGNNINVYFTDPPTTAATGNMFMLF